MTQHTRLTKSDLTAIDARFNAELDALGTPPTIDTLIDEGYTETRALNKALDMISSAGRVVTLLIAELLQAFGAVILGVVLVILEGDRIMAGSIALGLSPDKALLVAVAFTSLNAIMPIYRLRNLRGQTTIRETRHTLRGAVESFIRRLFALPQTHERDINHNPTLALAESAITWGTLFLATYAVMAGIIAQYNDLVWYQALIASITQSTLGELLQILSGLLIAIGGVFGVQSISHELGVRTITDQPQRLATVLAERRASYEQRKLELYEQIKEEHIAGKLADQRRKEEQKRNDPNFGVTISKNGHHNPENDGRAYTAE